MLHLAGGREKLFEKSFSLPPAPPSYFKNFLRKGLCNRDFVLFSADIHLYQPFFQKFLKGWGALGEGKLFQKVFLPPKKHL